MMNGKQIMFFCTDDDLKPVIENLENEYAIKYIKMGLFDEKENTAYLSFESIPHFGYPKVGDWIQDDAYMLSPKDTEITIREVAQRKGGIKYAIDPLANQTSICLQSGGIVSDSVLLAGKCGTTFLNEFSLDIFQRFFLFAQEAF